MWGEGELHRARGEGAAAGRDFAADRATSVTEREGGRDGGKDVASPLDAVWRGLGRSGAQIRHAAVSCGKALEMGTSGEREGGGGG